MKKLILALMALWMPAICSSQIADSNNRFERVNPDAVYQLYPTQNIWTFIKLDTRNGLMWRVQFSVKGAEYRYEEPLNREKLLTNRNEERAGRFTLYPTQNMNNFLLLDRLKGYVWQVQWPRDSEQILLIM